MNHFTDFTKMLMISTMVIILHTSAAKTEDDFTPYVKQFEKECNIVSGSIVTYGKDFDKHVIGYCTPYNKNVKINRRFWDMATAYEREWLIFHELGHCDLGLDHDDKYITIDDEKYGKVRIPKSIMSTEMFYVNTYIAYRSYYVKELCGKK